MEIRSPSLYGDKFMKKLVTWDNSTHMQKLRWVSRKWWFWVGVVLLLVLAVYLKGYFDWYLAGAKYREINANAQAYIASQEKQQAALEAAYKNDTYGGATPEETLRLFIEALEKKDYTLASNYFVPEERAKNLEKMPQGVASGGLASLVAAYKQGTVKFTKFSGQNKYEADVIPLGETVGFYFRFVLNEFNKKWLISDL